MREEGFLRRWARRKTESQLGQEPAPEPAQEEGAPAAASATPADPAPGPLAAPGEGACARTPAADATALPTPTMADVALLTPESDYSGFVARGVDQAVRRTALKKLFADPHFNLMDRLDVYIDDYNKPSPVSPEMLASLRHAKSVFAHLVGEGEGEGQDAGAALAAQAPPPSAGPVLPAVQPAAPADAMSDARPDALPEPAAVIACASHGLADSAAAPQHIPTTYQQHPPETGTP